MDFILVSLAGTSNDDKQLTSTEKNDTPLGPQQISHTGEDNLHSKSSATPRPEGEEVDKQLTSKEKNNTPLGSQQIPHTGENNIQSKSSATPRPEGEEDINHLSSTPLLGNSFTMDMIIHNQVTGHTSIHNWTVNVRANDHPRPGKTYYHEYLKWEDRVPTAFIAHLRAINNGELGMLSVLINSNCLPNF